MDLSRQRRRGVPWLPIFLAVLCAVGRSVTLGSTQRKMLGVAVAAKKVAPTRTMLLYIVSHNDDYQRERILELKQTFQDKFLVVWDNNEETTCPFQDIAACLDNERVGISTKQRFNYICCGLEKAVMWSIDNRSQFDYVWFMEDDVHYTAISELVNVLGMPSTADLLHQRAIKTVDHEWSHAETVHQQAGQIFGSFGLRRTMLNFYRMSSPLLDALAKIYDQRQQQWIFFESLIPTAAEFYNMTVDNWTTMYYQHSNYQVVANLRFRPCFTTFPTPGFYHPVKYRDGSFQNCTVDNVYV